MPWRGPEHPGDFPTLGYDALDWITYYLATPDRTDYEPLNLTREQVEFVLNFYAIDPKTGRRVYRRGVISRPKGWGKSPLLAGLACLEALGPVVPDGWTADGEPVGMPWSRVRTPWVQIAAVSEDQTRNAWSPLLEMLREGPAIEDYPGLEPMDSFVNLPKGRLEFVTSAATSREGNRPVFCVLDQTEEWIPSNGGRKLAATLRRNLAKTGGSSIESPNAFVPGRDSVAEASAKYAAKIGEGKARSRGLLYDHREWPATTDMTDRRSLLTGLAYAYGDSAKLSAGCQIHQPPCKPAAGWPKGWVELPRLVEEIWDPDTDTQDARLYYGNEITHAADAWLARVEWSARYAGVLDPEPPSIADGETITLGFDGSRKRAQGTTDATALIGCRVSDGHLFEIKVWEQPPGPDGKDWQVPADEVDRVVHETFGRYRVVGFYGDPAKWEGYFAKWEAKFGRRVKVKASRDHPFEWWMTGGSITKVVRALEQFHNAVIDGELSHDGSSVLMRHITNARRRIVPQGISIAKAFPSSPDKIDAAVAAVLAWQARLDAVAARVNTDTSRQVVVPRRIR